MTQTAAYPEVADQDDLDLLEDSRFRPSRVTLGLVLAILGVLVFTGGALVQRHWGAAPGGSAGAAARAGALPGGEGFGAGLPFPGGAGGAGGAGGFAGQEGAAAGGQAGSATPVVVGTVSRLSASRMIVKNLGGTRVTVKLPSGVTITLVKASTVPSLATGATVSVAGTTAADGTVTATSVTVR